MDIGVIGAGAMGKNHIRIYSEMRRVSSLFVFDTNPVTLRAMEQQYSAIPCGSVEEILKQCDAVNICVPTPYHYEIARTALAAGVPMLIEKPICATLQEGEKLLPQIPKDLVVGIGHIERFNPIVKEIQQIVRTPLYVEIKRHNPASSRVTGSSVVEDLMIHDIDIVFQLFKNQEYTLSSAGNDDVCTALLTIDSIPIYLSASRRAAKKMRSIYIECDDSTIEGNFMTQEVTVYRRPGQYAVESQRYVQESVIETVMVNKVEPLKLELATFLDCVQQGKPFPVTPRQAVRNLAVCEEIRSGCRS